MLRVLRLAKPGSLLTCGLLLYWSPAQLPRPAETVDGLSIYSRPLRPPQ